MYDTAHPSDKHVFDLATKECAITLLFSQESHTPSRNVQYWYKAFHSFEYIDPTFLTSNRGSWDPYLKWLSHQQWRWVVGSDIPRFISRFLRYPAIHFSLFYDIPRFISRFFTHLILPYMKPSHRYITISVRASRLTYRSVAYISPFILEPFSRCPPICHDQLPDTIMVASYAPIPPFAIS